MLDMGQVPIRPYRIRTVCVTAWCRWPDGQILPAIYGAVRSGIVMPAFNQWKVGTWYAEGSRFFLIYGRQPLFFIKPEAGAWNTMIKREATHPQHIRFQNNLLLLILRSPKT